jgi:hypothetical protein
MLAVVTLKRGVARCDRMVLLVSATCFPESRPEKFRRLSLQSIGQFANDFQPDIAYAALNPAQVDPIHLGVMGQLLLRNLLRMPDAPKINREKGAKVHSLAKTIVV